MLLDHQLDALSRRLSKTNVYNLAAQLNISTQVVDASFCYFCTDSISTEKATHHVLTNWLNRQNNRKEAYLKLGEALTHPDVGLNLLAREVLHYPPMEKSSQNLDETNINPQETMPPVQGNFT